MEDSAQSESALAVVKNSLSFNKIKLWESPYTQNDTINDEEVIKLAINLTPSLNLSEDFVILSLRRLAENALDKIKARNDLKATGKTRLKIKFPKNSNLNITDSIPRIVDLNLNEETGQGLAGIIGSWIERDPLSLKLISGGKVLGSDLTFLKPGSLVLVLPINKDNESFQIVLEQYKILENIKEDAQLLTGDSTGIGEEFNLEISDQSGKPLELPLEERRSLILAMSLHEKGKTSLKSGEYSLALILLLEALREYDCCRSTLLETVDNYGLLNLDIAWCYLKLNEIGELPKARQRLLECERNFNKTYGSDYSRLLEKKGTTGVEMALIARLHLLQGIVAYHCGDSEGAKKKLLKTKAELNKLIVPEDSIEELVAQGFTAAEARMGLRARDHNIPNAADFISSRRKEIDESKKRAKKEKQNRAKRRKLGKTADGSSYINVGYYETMVGMGFPSNMVAASLSHCNNDMGEAIDIIQNNPDMLVLTNDNDVTTVVITDAIIASVTAMGFNDLEAIKKAIIKAKGNVEDAIDRLTNPDEYSDSSSEEEDEAHQEICKKKKDAYSRMKENIGDNIDGHLDLTLIDESTYLEKYLLFLT